jgi:hypothetical protein
VRIAGYCSRFSMIVVLAVCGELLAQNPQLNTRTGSRFPTVVFTSVLWSAEPAYYSIAVDATGTATYQSAPESVGRTGVPYTINFYVSDRTRRTIFNVARELDFFRGEIEVQPVSAATDKALTLMYHDLGFTTRLTYSGSSDSDVEELTSIFEEVSETLEYGRRLAYLQQHERKKIAAELKALQANADRHVLRELQIIAPVLRGLSADSGLDADSRRMAQSLADGAMRHVQGALGTAGAGGGSKP